MNRAALLVLFALTAAAPMLAAGAESECERLGREIERLREKLDELRETEVSRQAGEEAIPLRTRLSNHLFSWRTDDGDFAFRMETSVRVQYTWHDTRGQGGSGITAENSRDFNNFRILDARLKLEGHIFGPQFQYRFQVAFTAEDSLALRMEDVWLRWEPLPLIAVTVGQMRVPYNYEALVEDTRRALPGRSSADKAFQQSWAKGASLKIGLDLWELAANVALLTAEIGVYNGSVAGNGNQGLGGILYNGNRSAGIGVRDADATENFTGGFRNSDAQTQPDSFSRAVDGDLMVAGRIEFHPMGPVDSGMVDLRSSYESEEWLFSVGVAANWFSARVDSSPTFLGNFYRSNEDTGGKIPTVVSSPPPSGRSRLGVDMLSVTVDGHFRWFGVAVNWALFYRRVEFHNYGALRHAFPADEYTVKEASDLGATVEVNFFLLPQFLNLATRFSMVDFDEFKTRNPSGAPVDGDAFGADTVEWGAGPAFYLHGQNLMIQTEYRYVIQQLPHGVSKGSDATAGIVRTSDYRTFQEIRLLLQWIF